MPVSSIASRPIVFTPPTKPTPPATGDLKAYAAKLNKMTGAQLDAEIANQKQRLWIAQHGFRFDPVMAADATAKLKLCMAEKASRPVGAYQAKLDKMTLPQLRAEQTKIEFILKAGRLTPEGVKLWGHRLERVKAEIASRSEFLPIR